jgi:hypothetical protein
VITELNELESYLDNQLQAQLGRYQRLLVVSANISPSTETLGWLNHAIALQQTDSPIKRLANSVRDARNRLVNVRNRLVEAPVVDVVDRAVTQPAKTEPPLRSVFAVKVPTLDREEPMDVVEGRPPGDREVAEVDEVVPTSPPISPAPSRPTRKVLEFLDCSEDELDEAAE